MSVIVKGMEMPQNCFACACASYYGRIDRAMCDLTNKQLDQKAWKKERHPNCPLVEIPTPHGRLIDADELKTAFPRCDNSMDIKIASVRATINHALTVIEAEGSEET